MDGTESPGLDPIATAIGYRIEQERMARNLTREALAAAAGLDVRHVWRIETGRGNVQVRSVLPIARGLGITLAQLVEGLEGLIADPPERPKPKRRGPLPRNRVQDDGSAGETSEGN